MFDWVRREWEGWKEFARYEPEYLDASWLLEEGWVEGFSIPLALRDAPIEIRRVEWDASIITSIDELRVANSEINCAAGMYWRKTGIYRVREEEEHARACADRLLGRHRLIAVDSSAGVISSQLANMAQQQAIQFGTGINNLLGGILGGGPYGMR